MITLRANIVDVVGQRLFYGELNASQGHINAITALGAAKKGKPWLMPGFVDAHVHIESSMLTPDQFAIAALEHGTLATVSDPHEIANVLGIEGIRFMHRRAALSPLKILFGAPACVPATPFETAGASLSAEDIDSLFSDGQAGYLSEMMNYPGVLNRDEGVMRKISVATSYRLPVDGHAPGLRGPDARRYANAGITTDHECTSLAEAWDKIDQGMFIQIREGSAARDFATLHPLLASHAGRVMLCSDDKHPDDLLKGHIRQLVIRSLSLGYPLFQVLQAATLNAVNHYRLPLGLLQIGDPMDALLVRDLNDFVIESAWLDGREVVHKGRCTQAQQAPEHINRFAAQAVHAEQFAIPHPGGPCRVIVAGDGQLWTQQRITNMPQRDGLIVADTDRDLLFIAVVNRYQVTPPSVALVHGFGLLEGALASSIAHDSHNIIAVGTSAQWLAAAINAVITERGALVAADPQGSVCLPLPVAGLMSDQPASRVGPAYQQLNGKARAMGSRLSAPLMTLSFMALLVIPEIKLSDRGLFDAEHFRFCELGVSSDEAGGQVNG